MLIPKIGPDGRTPLLSLKVGSLIELWFIVNTHTETLLNSDMIDVMVHFLSL